MSYGLFHIKLKIPNNFRCSQREIDDLDTFGQKNLVI